MRLRLSVCKGGDYYVVLDILQLKCSGFRSQHEDVVDNKLSNRHRPAHWWRATPGLRLAAQNE